MSDKPKSREMADILASVRQATKQAAREEFDKATGVSPPTQENPSKPYLLGSHYRVAAAKTNYGTKPKKPLMLSPSRRVGFQEPSSVQNPRNSSDLSLDQAELQQLVSDIVREELQGAMGEKFTMNMRKLVRQEMELAAAMKEKPDT